MSTVTAHTLFSRAATYSTGATSLLGCPNQPAVVSLPFARNSGKKTPRSLCYYADPKSIDHPSNIPPVALVRPQMPSTITKDANWKITEDNLRVELTFFYMPEDAEPEHFEVVVQGDVLVIRKPPADQPEPQPHEISFRVQLLLPLLYDKEKITAEIQRPTRTLTVTIPKFRSLPDSSAKVPVYKKVVVEKIL